MVSKKTSVDPPEAPVRRLDPRISRQSAKRDARAGWAFAAEGGAAADGTDEPCRTLQPATTWLGNGRLHGSGGAAGAVSGPISRPVPALARVFSETVRPLEERLGRTELRRRAWHILPGFLPFLRWPIPQAYRLSPAIVSPILAGITLALAWAICANFRQIQRGGETLRDRLASVWGYAGCVVTMLVFYSSHPELAFTVLAVLAFGDGSATLGGMLAGGRRLPWNGEKTIFGTACFILVGTPMTALIYWGEAHLAFPSTVTFKVALLCALGTTALGALAESLPSRINDNLRVGVASSIAVFVFHGMIVS